MTDNISGLVAEPRAIAEDAYFYAYATIENYKALSRDSCVNGN